MLTIESPTRITLALDIIKKLDSGYHELGIVKHQISLSDTITISPHEKTRDTVECDDSRVPCDDTNICVKAAKLMREKFKIDKYFRIVIKKNIPVMGGLAGGSANAAAMLRAVAGLWKIPMTTYEFRKLGAKLGMDVPFFFPGKTAFDSEATGVIKPIDIALEFHIILAIPDFGVSTKEAYDCIDYTRIGKKVSLTDGMIGALIRGDFVAAQKFMHNDFELTVFEKYPRLKNIRDNLLEAGCVAAAMSGSGSTIVGIAPDENSAKKIAEKIDCETIITKSLTGDI